MKTSSTPVAAPPNPSTRPAGGAPQGQPPAAADPQGPAGAVPAAGALAMPAARAPARRVAAGALAAAGRATVNSSAATALAATARGIGNTVVPPALRDVGRHVLTSMQRASPGAAQVRGELQRALDHLGNPPAGANLADAQQAAHDALLDYARSKASYADAALPVLHKTLAVGAAGAGMAFGVGRSTGVAAADTLMRMHRGDEAGHGLYTAAVPPGRPGTDAVVNAVTQAALGSALGGVGSFLGQSFVAPLVNRINKQMTPVDLKAVVPDAMVARMNAVHEGSGDALRREAQSEQARNLNIGSDRNIAVGQFFFDAANATRAAMQGQDAPGLAGNVLFGTAVSALAGGAIGATIAINSSLAKIRVPDMAALNNLAPNAGAEALKALPHHEVPLFYTRRAEDPKWSSIPVMDPVARPPADAPVPAGNVPPAAVPRASVAASLVNAATSSAMRATAMLKATAGTTVVGAMAPAFVASMPSEGTATAARAAAAAVGIHTAIRPWFGELAKGIPEGDKAIVAARQRAVDNDARRREAQNAAQAALGGVQMVPVHVPAGTP